jgi:LPS export ABC transporter protein LptC
LTNKNQIKILSIGLFLSSVLFFSCTNDYEAIIDEINYDNHPSQSAENIEIQRTDSGKIILKIFAPILERYTFSEESKSYDEFPKGIKVLTYTNYPEVSSSLTCNYAKHIVRTNKWEARDNVVAVNADGDTLKTEQMFWDNEKGNIYSDKPVNIRTENEIIYGTGFTAKQDFSGWKINKVKGTIYLDE